MHDGVEAAHGGGERARACPVAAQKFWRGAAAVARHLGGSGATALLGAAGERDADARLCEVRGGSRSDAAGAADDEDALRPEDTLVTNGHGTHATPTVPTTDSSTQYEVEDQIKAVELTLEEGEGITVEGSC